jgi:Na+/H+ antiporter NhaC
MKISIDLKTLIVSLACFAITFLMVSGILQKTIHFQGIANEIFFTALTFTLGSLFFIGSFSKK